MNVKNIPQLVNENDFQKDKRKPYFMDVNGFKSVNF